VSWGQGRKSALFGVYGSQILQQKVCRKSGKTRVYFTDLFIVFVASAFFFFFQIGMMEVPLFLFEKNGIFTCTYTAKSQTQYYDVLQVEYENKMHESHPVHCLQLY
jgi:hypothetical protein